MYREIPYPIHLMLVLVTIIISILMVSHIFITLTSDERRAQKYCESLGYDKQEYLEYCVHCSTNIIGAEICENPFIHGHKIPLETKVN